MTTSQPPEPTPERTPEPPEAPDPTPETHEPAPKTPEPTPQTPEPTPDPAPKTDPGWTDGLRGPRGCAEWTVVILGVIWVVLAIIFVIALVVRLNG